jgi:N-acetylmuramoyl-L-alanine amidase
MTAKRGKSSSFCLAFGLVAVSLSAQAQTPPPQLTVVSGDQIDTIPVSELGGVSMAPLTALAQLVGAEIRPASEQGVILSAGGNMARLTDGGNFVSVKQQLVLLTSPARRVTGQWFVPLDFISKVLPTFATERLTYRDSDRLLLVGDAFPRLEVRSTRDPSYTRIEVSTNRPVPIEMSQTEREVRLTIQTPYLETTFQDEEILDEVVERISLRKTGRNYELSVMLGKRFWTLQASKRESPDHAVVLDLLRSRVPVRTATAGPPGEVETIREDLRSIDRRSESGSAEGAAPDVPAPPDEPGAPVEPAVDEIFLSPESGSPSAEDILSRNSGPTRLRIVALDPGHGGAEVGAEGKNGLVEKELVLSIARRLRELLQERLGLQVILTRDGDRELALDERTAAANNNKADLFVSIHADASPIRDASGSSVYFLSYSSSGGEGAVTSARGRSVPGDASLDFILWDMAQASHLSQSSRLAEIFQEELLMATGSEKSNRGIKQNTFRVLKGATMPAVLVEVGFISNPQEEELLKTRQHQERIAEAMYRGVLRFKDVYEFEPRAEGVSQGRHGQK